MRARTAVCLCIAGAVLTFAVSGHPAAVDVRLIGVILTLTGAAGLMLTGAVGAWPQRGKSWLLSGRSRLRQLVDEVAPVQGVRVPLDDLLGTGRRGTPAPGHVWTAQAGHEGPARVRASPLPEVTRDDQTSERAQAGQGQRPRQLRGRPAAGDGAFPAKG